MYTINTVHTADLYMHAKICMMNDRQMLPAGLSYFTVSNMTIRMTKPG